MLEGNHHLCMVAVVVEIRVPIGPTDTLSASRVAL
jgi:hypothetical protein